MKTQTFLLSLQDKNGIQKDFYRFTHKKYITCINETKKAVKNNSIFKTLWNADNIVKAVLYATPDGYNKGSIVFFCDIQEIYNASLEV